MREMTFAEVDSVEGGNVCKACSYALGIGGGVVSGGAAGARIGAVFGSGFRPVGMAAGAVLGGLAGAAIAYQATH